MGHKILSVSIPEHMIAFFNENSSLSPSKLLQSKIIEIMEQRKFNPELNKTKGEMQRLVSAYAKLQKELQRATDFITKHNLWNSYISEVENVL